MLGMLVAGGLLFISNFVSVWLPLDILRHFTIHLIIIAAACMVGLLMPFARLTTAVVLAIAGSFLIGSYAHYIGAPAHASPSLKPQEKAFRIMTFNTQINNSDVDALASEIRRLNPDLVTLIELGPNKRRIFGLLKQDYPYVVACGKDCQFGLLSKVPISLVESKHHWGGPWLVRASLGGVLSGTTIVGVHVARPPRITTQFKQFKVLGKYLGGIPGRLIVMGDFNATPFSRLFAELAQHSSVRRLTSIPSWPSYFGLPQVAIDHVLVSPEIRQLDRAKLGFSAGSDHYPVVLTVGLPLAQRDVAGGTRGD